MNLTTKAHTLKCYDLRRMAEADRAEDLFLGAELQVSSDPNWRFCRAKAAGLSGTFDSADQWLVVLILEGALTLSSGQITISLAAGQTAAIRPGTQFNWQSHDETEWLINLYREGEKALAASGPSLILLAQDAPQQPSASPSPAVLITPAPTCSKAVFTQSADGNWSSGTWTATPYERIPIVYDFYEMMQLFEGSVTLFSPSGESVTYHAGDVFLVAKGAELGWRSTTTVKKLWSSFTPLIA